jgi:hypothetical protein
MAVSHYREQKTPRISANELARFMVATDLGREGIIRNARWQGTVRVVRYRKARGCIGRFLADKARSHQIIADGRAEFEAILDNPFATPFQQEDARASILALDNFQRRWNQLGLGGFNFAPAPRLSPIVMEGVEVTVTLDSLVKVPDPDRVGGILLRMARGTTGETEGAASKRREIGRNAAVLIFLGVSEHLPKIGTPSPEHCFSVDVQHGEAHATPRNYLPIGDNMRAACRAIAAQWDTVQPPGSA